MKYIVGNWKMNGNSAMIAEFLPQLAAFCADNKVKNEVVICPPFPLISLASEKIQGSFLRIGAQDVSANQEGAYTGEISAKLLKESGCSYVIVGHSERRQYHAESDSLVKAKAEAAINAGIIPIICVGETIEQRKSGKALEIVKNQLAQSLPLNSLINSQKSGNSFDFLLAYEPVWAIGSGQSATNSDIAEMHSHIYDCVCAVNDSVKDSLILLYGGSVKAANACEIMQIPHVSGVLVGGASLKIEEFSDIVISGND